MEQVPDKNDLMAHFVQFLRKTGRSDNARRPTTDVQCVVLCAASRIRLIYIIMQNS